jgi:hypothetical protein
MAPTGKIYKQPAAVNKFLVSFSPCGSKKWPIYGNGGVAGLRQESKLV